MYHNKPITTSEDDKTYERLLIKKKSTTPNNNSGRPALELFIQKVRDDLLTDRPNHYVAPNLSAEHRKALREMQFWEKDHDIIIRPYDKGQGFFIDYKSSYKNRVLKDLNSDIYKKLTVPKHVTTNEVTNKIVDWAEKWKSNKLLTTKLTEWIIPSSDNKPGKISMNYKKHKKDFPGRLITSGCGSLTENLSSLVATTLKPLAEALPHIIMDTNEQLRKIDKLNASKILIGKKIIHVSFDVIAMFPNMPKDIGIMRCREELNKRPCGHGLPTDCIIEALEIYMPRLQYW